MSKRDERACFLAGLSDQLRDTFASAPALAETLAQLIRQSREAWPSVKLSTDVFLAYVASRVSQPEPETLMQLHWGDLYVACACSLGDSAAISCFESLCVVFYAELQQKLKVSPAQFEEHKQALWVELFSGDEETPPKITKYTGQGKLVYWTRVTFLRHMLRALQGEKKEVPVEEEMLVRLTPAAVHTEASLMKNEAKEELRKALAEAIRALSARERNILRHHYIDGLNTEKVGAIFGVHRATVARWLQKIRDSLFLAISAKLVDKMNIADDEFDSIIHLLHSHLDITIPQVSRRRPKPKNTSDE